MFSGEQLLNLIKNSASSDKKQHGREDRGRSMPSIASRDIRSKARPASELEAQWQKEVDAKKAREDEARRLEEEKRRQEEEKAEQERLKKVCGIRRTQTKAYNFCFCFISLFFYGEWIGSTSQTTVSEQCRIKHSVESLVNDTCSMTSAVNTVSL